jgi:hypothetical protein
VRHESYGRIGPGSEKRLGNEGGVVMAKCQKCGDTGVIETGNNDLPCGCPAGDTALFNEAGVRGPVTGLEIRKHFLNDSPEPIAIPSRGVDGRTE